MTLISRNDRLLTIRTLTCMVAYQALSAGQAFLTFMGVLVLPFLALVYIAGENTKRPPGRLDCAYCTLGRNTLEGWCTRCEGRGWV